MPKYKSIFSKHRRRSKSKKPYIDSKLGQVTSFSTVTLQGIPTDGTGRILLEADEFTQLQFLKLRGSFLPDVRLDPNTALSFADKVTMGLNWLIVIVRRGDTVPQALSRFNIDPHEDSNMEVAASSQQIYKPRADIIEMGSGYVVWTSQSVNQINPVQFTSKRVSLAKGDKLVLLVKGVPVRVEAPAEVMQQMIQEGDVQQMQDEQPQQPRDNAYILTSTNIRLQFHGCIKTILKGRTSLDDLE